MTGTNEKKEKVENTSSVKKSSLWLDAWRRLKKNKSAMVGLGIVILLFLTAIFADFIAPYHYADMDLSRRLQGISANNWFGTDEYGRDIFSRIVYGSRISLLVGFITITMSVFAGGLLGAVAGYAGKWMDHVIMRLMDILLAVPNILLAIVIVATLEPNLRNTMIAISVGSIPAYARIFRASVLSLRDQEFIEAARASGAGDGRIIFRHIVPNCLAPIIVQATLGVAGAILAAAALSFIGLGLQPPSPEWGAMLSSGRQFLRDTPHLTTFPGLAIMIVILGLNLFGDGLRDALDPKLKN